MLIFWQNANFYTIKIKINNNTDKFKYSRSRHFISCLQKNIKMRFNFRPICFTSNAPILGNRTSDARENPQLSSNYSLKREI